MELLDGDAVRENLSKGLGFSRQDRDINVRRIAFVAGLPAKHGVTVLFSAISPPPYPRALRRGPVGITLGPVKTHNVQVGDVTRELPIVEVAPGVSVALFNMLGDTEVTEAAGKALARLLPADIDVLVTPEVKALSLAHVISRETGRPYIVVRKTQKPYMVDPVAREVVSITTGIPQLLVLDGFDVPKIKGRKVAIVDDVVSSGGTLHSLRQIIEEVGGEVCCILAVFTEGEEREEVTALGHLPLFPSS